MEKWNSIVFVKIKLFILKVPNKNTLRTFAVAKNTGFTFGRHLVSGLGCGFLLTSSQERKFT